MPGTIAPMLGTIAPMILYLNIIPESSQDAKLFYWWKSCYDRFEVLASQLVIQEAEKGDTDASQARLDVLNKLTLLEATDNAFVLAQALVNTEAIPKKSVEDAIHIAIAVTHGVEYLVTWNCKHIANVMRRPLIEAVCREMGYEPVLICTPEQMLEVE